MKLSLTLSLLLGMATLFQGCGDTPEEAPTSDKTTIQGSATLGSLLNNDATVCLDLNNNKVCDSDEPSTQTSPLGEYKLTVDGTVEDGTLIIAYEGVNLLPPPTGEHQNLKFYKHYQQIEGSQNVNVFSSLVVHDMQDSLSTTYDDAKANIVAEYFTNSTKCASVDVKQAIKSPLDEGNELLVCMNGLQALTYDTNTTLLQASAQRASTTGGSDLDGYIEDNQTYYDSFLTAVDDYLDMFSDWWDSFWSDTDEEPATEPPVVEEPPVTVVEKDIKRPDLNGVWYIIDQSGDKTCSLIDSNDNIKVTEADGTVTDLSLTFSKNGDIIESMTLKLGFFTADTINFAAYRSDFTFDGSYSSDGETLSGIKMDDYNVCTSTKLGL